MTFKKTILRLILLSFLLFVAGYLSITTLNISLTLFDLSILILCFFAINLAILFIFIRGLAKEPAGRTIYLIAAISVKMLMEMVLALSWFFLAKKNSASSLLLFFVLYLAFSLFSMYLMLNTLKNNSL